MCRLLSVVCNLRNTSLIQNKKKTMLTKIRQQAASCNLSSVHKHSVCLFPCSFCHTIGTKYESFFSMSDTTQTKSRMQNTTFKNSKGHAGKNVHKKVCRFVMVRAKIPKCGGLSISLVAIHLQQLVLFLLLLHFVILFSADRVSTACNLLLRRPPWPVLVFCL